MMNPAEFANIARAEDGFWWYRGMRQIMFRLLDPIARRRQFQRVLEAGCGTAHFAKALSDRYGWAMYPVDLGWEGLAYGKTLNVQRLVQCDIAAIPYANAVFDLVVSMDVIVHFRPGEEHKPLAEFARVLQPRGLLVVRVSALDILRSRHSMFAHERQRFTKRRLMETVERAGFLVLRCTYANSLLMPIAFAKFRIWEPLTNAPASSGVGSASAVVDSALYVPLAMEAALIGTGADLPVGQSLILIAEKPA